MESLSEVLQPVTSIQPMDKNHIIRAFAVQHWHFLSFLIASYSISWISALFIWAVNNIGLFNWILLDDVMLAFFFWCRYLNVTGSFMNGAKNVWWIYHQHIWLTFASWDDKLWILYISLNPMKDVKQSHPHQL